MKLHLPKLLLTALLAAASSAAYAANTEIWVNFGTTEVNDSTWNDIVGTTAGAVNGNYALKDTNGTVVGSLLLNTTASPWGPESSPSTLIEKMQSSYLDYQAGGSTWTINFAIDDIDASNITLNAYVSGDNDTPNAPININGTNYIGGGEANTVSDESWGNRNTARTSELGAANTVTVTGLSGSVTLTPKTTSSNAAGRATLSGLSIVWDGSTSATGIELNSGVNEAASYLEGVAVENRVFSLTGNADNTSSFNIAGGETLQGLQAAANTVTITSDGAISTSKLWAKNGATLNLNAALAENTALSVGGMGTVNINASQTLGSLSSLVSTLGIGGNSTITVSGAASFAGLDVASGSKLALNGSVNGSFILNATGSGTIELNNGATVIIPGANNGKPGDGGTASAVNSTAFAGVISVKSGTLSLGDNGGEQNYWGLDLGSLKSIDLDGGSMRLFGAASTISTINVNTASSMTIHQASVTQSSATGDAATSGVPGYRINNLVLNENLSIRTNWRSVVEIGKLSCAADLSMDTAGSDRVLSLYVNKVDATAGMNINFAANVNATLGGAANSELTDAAHTLGGTITTAANLTVNGSIAITDDLSGFRLHTQSSGGTLTENGGQDGYMTTTGSTYYLIDNTGSGTVTLSSTTATYGGGTIELTKDSAGDVTFVGGTSTDTLYRVNTADVTVGGTGATANTGRATAFIIAQDRTVTIAGDSAAATADTILRDSSGEGNLVLSTDATLKGGQQTQLGGKLTVGEGVTLSVGAGSGDSSNISSFKGGVELAGGSLMINGAAQEVNSLTVSKASILGVANKNQGHQTYTLTGTTQLNDDLEYTNSVANEHGDLVIKNLSGSGMLSTNGGTGDWGANALKVEKLTEYTGSIKVDGGNRNNYRNYVEFGTSTTEGDVTMKTSAFSSLKGLELTNKAYATVHSTGNSTIEKVVLNNGSLQYESDGGSYTYSLGDVTSDGASSISMDAGKAEITKLTLNSGQLSVTGSLTIGELVLDLSKYTDMAQTYTLVTTTGEGATVGLSTAYSTEYNGYTASVSGSGTDSLTLSFAEIVAPGGPITTTVTGQGGFAEGMLTLNVEGDLTSATQVFITGINDSIMAEILGLSGLPADGMVGITLQGAEGGTFTADADQMIGFQGKDGVNYYFGEQVGSAWQYQVAYIPEPASATLGLAALMMLAARRRRKA